MIVVRVACVSQDGGGVAEAPGHVCHLADADIVFGPCDICKTNKPIVSLVYTIHDCSIET